MELEELERIEEPMMISLMPCSLSTDAHIEEYHNGNSSVLAVKV
jgi:hypothetical protein